MTVSPGRIPPFNFTVDQDGYTYDFTEMIHNSVRDIMQRVAQAEDAAIRDGLIALGWTPPGEHLSAEWRVLWRGDGPLGEGVDYNREFSTEGEARKFIEILKGSPETWAPPVPQRRVVTTWEDVE